MSKAKAKRSTKAKPRYAGPSNVTAYREALARYGEMDASTPEADVEAALELCDELWHKLTPAQQDEFDGPQYAREPKDTDARDMFAALTAACARGAVGDWDGAQVQLLAAVERAPTKLSKRAVQYMLQVTEEERHAELRRVVAAARKKA